MSLADLAISLPFKIDAIGKVAATVDQPKIWADRVRSVIGTSLGQRVYRPVFGCNATLSVFDTEDAVLTSIDTDIEAAFNNHLPLLSLLEVATEVSEKTEIITVNIVYQTPSGANYSVRLGIATISGSGPLTEEFAWQIQ
jgi:phage baseplate assembly protein W